jgi:hypothetical protein
MDAHMLRIRRAQKMHRVSHHHRPFVEMVLVAAVGFADAV